MCVYGFTDADSIKEPKKKSNANGRATAYRFSDETRERKLLLVVVSSKRLTDAPVAAQ